MSIIVLNTIAADITPVIEQVALLQNQLVLTEQSSPNRIAALQLQINNLTELINNLPNNSIESEEMALNQIIKKSPNWQFVHENDEWFWRSRGGESDTGIIEIGFLKLGTQLILLLNGGGTNGGQKTIELVEKGSNVVLATKTLNQLLSTDSNELRVCTWDTTNYVGRTAYIRAACFWWAIIKCY